MSASTLTLSKAPLAAIAGALAAAAVALALAFSLPAAFAGGSPKAFTVTAEITATYDKDGNITVPDVELTNDTGSAVVLKSAKMISDYAFVSGWTNDAAGKVVAAGETVTIKWSANGSKVLDGWGKGEKVRVGAVTYTYEPVDAAPADKIDISGASIETEDLVYNGQSQTARIKSVTLPDGTVLSEGDYHVSSGGTGTDAGIYGALTIQGDGDYTGTATGCFTISPKQMTEEELEAISLDFPEEGYTYDGKAKAPAVKGIPAGLAQGADYAAAYSDNVNAGAAKATITFKGNYAGSAERAYQIAKRSVTLASASASKTYDGTPLTDNSVTVSGDGFAEGEGAAYSVVGSQTLVGSSENKFTCTLNGNTKAGNYSIKTEAGTLSVKNRAESERYEISVEGNSTTATYDGAEHSAAGIASGSKTYTNDKGATFTVAAETTDPKSIDVTAKANEVSNVKVTDAAGNDVTAQFKVATADGKLTVNKKAATITAGSAEKEYDGTALTTDKFTTDGFVGGQGIASATIEGSQIVVGSSASTVKDKSWKAKDGTKLDNYEIKTAAGTLTVKDRTAKYQIELKGVTETKTYNGSEQTMYGVQTDEFEIDGVTYKVYNYKSDVTGKDADEYTQTITSTNEDGHWTVVDAKGNDVSSQFSVTTKPGKLTIDPKDVTITSASGEKTYDGAPLIKEEASVTAGGFAKGEEEGVSYTGFGSQTDAGSSDNTFKVTFDGKKAKAGNYNVTKVPGTLTVDAVADKVTVTITENGGTAVYDGAKHEATGYDVSSDNTLYTANDFSFSGNATVSGTDAGIYNMELKAEDFDNISKNFTDVEFVVVDGALTISPRKVTLTSANDYKVYDGTPLTNSEVTVSGDGFADGEGATYSVTGTITDYGSVENTFTYSLNGNTKADNYTITTAPGTLRVAQVTDQVTVTITGNTDSTTYDGTAHSVEGYTASIDGSALYTEGSIAFNGTAKAEGTDANTYNMGLAAEQFSNANPNFTNVRFVVTDGKLTVAAQSIDPDAATYLGVQINEPEDVAYDGNEHTWPPTVTGKGGNALEKDTDYSLLYAAMGNFINAGTVTVTIEGEGNYTGTVERSYEITPAAVTLASNSHEFIYNGSEQGDAAVTVSGADTLFRSQVEGLAVTGKVTNAGNTAENAIAYTWKDGFSADNFTIANNPGTLSVVAKSIDAEGMNVSQPGDVVYNGASQQQEPVVTDDGKKLAKGVDYDVTFSGDTTNAGTVTVTVEGKGNYTGTVERTYKITPVEVDDTVLDGIKLILPYNGYTYDGNEKKPEVTGLSGYDSDKDYKVEYSDNVNAGTAKATVAFKGNYQGEKEIQFPISPKQLSEEELGKIGLNADGLVYGADEKEPAVTGLDGYALNTDYVVSYGNNVNATSSSKATATVTFKGNYDGEKTMAFDIARKTVSVTWDPDDDPLVYTYDGSTHAPVATIEGAVGSDVLSPELSYAKGSESLESAPSDPGNYTVTVLGVLSKGSVAGNYALSTAGLSKGFSIAKEPKGYWLAAAGADNPSDPAGVLKTKDQIAEDMAVLHGFQSATSDNKDKAAVADEYTNYMNGKSADGTKKQEVRLYTKWSGSTVDGSGEAQAANKYVEFRIVQVGPHDGDGSAVTFAATHSLPTAQQMNSEWTNAGGWASSLMRTSVFSDNGYVQEGLSGLKDAVKSVSKTTAYRAGDSGDWSVTSDESTTSDSFWLLSNSEVFGTASEANALISAGCFKVEGSQYYWFKAKGVNAKAGWGTANDAIKDMLNTRSGSYPADRNFPGWLLRSPYVGDCFYFGSVASDGIPCYDIAGYAFGVVPAFSM